MASEIIRYNYNIINGRVQCRYCKLMLRIKRGTQHLIKHSEACKETYTNKTKKLTAGIAVMMITDLWPFNLVDGAAFESFVKSVNPNYKIPSQAVFSNEIIPKRHKDLFTRLQRNIMCGIEEGKMAAAFAIDTWTSVDSYLSVMIRYVTEDYKVNSYLLTVEIFPENCTDVYEQYRDVLSKTLKTWKLNKRLPVFCTTNLDEHRYMSNMWTRIPCFATCLQTAVISALMSLRTISVAGGLYRHFMKKCERTIRHFSKSVSARSMLMNICSDMSIEPVELSEQVNTACWISIYNMFKYLIQMRKPLTSINGIENFSEEEWRFMEDVLIVLELINETTEIMNTEEFPTLSLYYPTYCELKKKLKDFKGNTRIRKNILRALKEEFEGSIGIDEVKHFEALKHATLLDPRFKAEPFVRESDCSLKKDLRGKIISLCGINLESYKSMDQELNKYWLKNCIPKETNIINWWSDHRERFPILASAARHFLAIPAVRVSGKRFNAPRTIIQNNKTKLTLETMQMLCFLHANSVLETKMLL